MMKIEKKIIQLETQILEEHVKKEKELLITEMKKIGIEKLPYSYTALKTFIDPETMDFHYNKHYKGYVDKLNTALSKKKHGDLELEQIIKTISRFDKTIRNNAGGAFNHALFWNMFTPKPPKLKGELNNKIIKEFGSFMNFKKKFEAIAKDRFGSGWVWLVLTAKNGLKIMSTPNQDNPLMNVIEGGGFPLLGLDLWEHAYYLKYRNKRDDYIKNFWKVVNWDFVSKMYEMKTQTKLLESIKFGNLIKESKEARFCGTEEKKPFNEMINNDQIKKVYQDGVMEVLKKKFGQFWVEGNREIMSGFYGIESEGRSILNNLNTNFNTFCLLVEAINKEIYKIGRPEKAFNFSEEKKRNVEEIKRFVVALDHFKNKIFTETNEDFINIIKVLDKLWKKGEKSEDTAAKSIQDYFKGKAKVEKISGHGQKKDAFKGIDLKITIGNVVSTAQVKPFSSYSIDKNQIKVSDTGNVKAYDVDWIVFSNSKKTLIFKNDPLDTTNQYVFNIDSLLYEIE